MSTNNYPGLNELFENIGKNPGRYILPFAKNEYEDWDEDYDEEKGVDNWIENKEVNVVYTGDENARMLVIITEDKNGDLQDFYYNSGERIFKPLTHNYEDEDDYDHLTFRESWRMENVEARVPSQWMHYKPKPIKY